MLRYVKHPASTRHGADGDSADSTSVFVLIRSDVAEWK
jgi:hypothetical protein